MTEYFWQQVVDKDLNLNDDANIWAGGSIDRDHRLSTDLAIARFPEKTGVDRASGLASATIQRTIHGEFNQWNDVSKWAQPLNLLHMLLQVGQAIFQRQSPAQGIRIG